MKSLIRILLFLTLAAAVFGQTPGKSAGEQPAKSDSAVKKDTPEKDVVPEAFYKLAFNISEIEDGKRVNQREYSMVSRNNDGASRPPRVCRSIRRKSNSNTWMRGWISAVSHLVKWRARLLPIVTWSSATL
jgi:hypothetical protein